MRLSSSFCWEKTNCCVRWFGCEISALCISMSSSKKSKTKPTIICELKSFACSKKQCVLIRTSRLHQAKERAVGKGEWDHGTIWIIEVNDEINRKKHDGYPLYMRKRRRRSSLLLVSGSGSSSSSSNTSTPHSTQHIPFLFYFRCDDVSSWMWVRCCCCC